MGQKKDTPRGIISWAVYDWANSAFATTVMAGFFPLFFKAYWANQANVTMSSFYLGLANSLGSIIIAAISPFIGSIADRGTAKKRFLLFFAYLGILSTGCLWFVKEGMWGVAAGLYVAGAIGFQGGNIFYDSLLVGVASRKKVDFVSSLGFALGYIGGGLLFLLNVIMYQKPELFGISDGAAAIKLSFVTVALWWALFSLPIFIFVKEPDVPNAVPLSRAFKAGYRQLADTLKDVKHLKVVGLFLLAYWFYIDGVDTIIRMAVDYGTSLGFDSSALITALLIVQFVAFPSALLYNLLAKKIGIKRGILTAIFAYCFITVLAFFMQNETHFFILAMLVGMFQGGIQALSRSCYARIIPEKKAGEFYGFFNMLGKFAAVIGPALMGTVALVTGSSRISILSIIILFIIGALLFRKVDLKEGERMAKEYLT